MKPVENILRSANMSSRAAYYSGRGETLSDLNDTLLSNIFDQIDAEKEKKNAQAFVNMVADLYFIQQDLSATTFINSFYNLESAAWTYHPLEKKKSDASHMAQAAADETRQIGESAGALQGMMHLLGRFGTEKSDITRRQIAGRFLGAHADLLTERNKQFFKNGGPSD